MVAKTTALIFMMFSLNFQLVVATMFQRTSNSVRGENNERRTINDRSSDRKHTIHEAVQIKFVAGHGGSGHAGGGGGHAGGGSGHGGGASHEGGGSGGYHGEGSDSSTKTPGSSSVVPIHGAAGAKVRGHQNHHKSGVHGHTSSLGILSAAILLSLIF